MVATEQGSAPIGEAVYLPPVVLEQQAQPCVHPGVLGRMCSLPCYPFHRTFRKRPVLGLVADLVLGLIQVVCPVAAAV